MRLARRYIFLPINAALLVTLLVLAAVVVRSACAEGEYTGPIEVRLKYLYAFDVKLSGKPLGWVDQILIDDSTGEIYILDKNNRRIVVTDIRGGYIFHFDYTLAGIKGPIGLDVDSDTGEFYVAEPRRISVLNYRGEFLREVDLSKILAEVDDISIQSIVLADEGGTTLLYIGDNLNRRIVVITPQGDFVREYTDRNKSMGNNITSIHVFGDRIFWLDSTGFAVRSIPKGGGPVKSFGRISSLLGGFSMPVDMDIDVERKRIIVVDSNRMMVIAFDMDGNVLFEFGGPRMLSWPRAVAVNTRGHIFVADTRGAIRVFEAIPLVGDEEGKAGGGP